MIVFYDKEAGEITIETDQGFIVINECNHPKFTRIVVSPDAGGVLNNEPAGIGSPSILCMYGPVAVSEPQTGDEDTQECPVAIYDDLEVD